MITGEDTWGQVMVFIYLEVAAILIVFIAVVVVASQIQYDALRILPVLRNCPAEYFSDTEVNRLIFLRSSQVGLIKLFN